MWRDRLVSIDALQRQLRAAPVSRWASAGEIQRLSEMTSADRRLRWLSGRWLAKHLLRELLDDPMLSLPALHIESRDALGRSCRPRVFYRGKLQDWVLTISHAGRSVYAAASTDPDLRLGGDLMDVAPLNAAFLRFWFSPGERSWCRDHEYAPAACAIWSLKESWYKAINAGQPFAPRSVDVTRLTPIGRLSAEELSQTSRGDFTCDGRSCTIVCRRLPHELAALVLVWDGRTSRSKTLPALSSIPFPVRQDWKGRVDD